MPKTAETASSDAAAPLCPPFADAEGGAAPLAVLEAETSATLEELRAEARRATEEARAAATERAYAADWRDFSRGDLQSAEHSYRKSLAITLDLDDRPSLAATYHQLGWLAELREDLAVAEVWYHKSLAIEEDLGNRPGMALTYGSLCILALTRGDIAAALDWGVRANALFPDFPSPVTGNSLRQLALSAIFAGWPALEKAWRQISGENLPAAVRAALPALIEEVRPLAETLAADFAKAALTGT